MLKHRVSLMGYSSNESSERPKAESQIDFLKIDQAGITDHESTDKHLKYTSP